MMDPNMTPMASDDVIAYSAFPDLKPIPEAPYRGIEPFRFIDQQIFVARDTETWNLISSIMIYRGVLLYGGSGTGKSSMINAGLIPKALKENFLPNILRVQPRKGKEIKIQRIPIEADGKPPYLPSTFTTDDDEFSFECSIQEVYDTLKKIGTGQADFSKPPEMRPMLIFDQFEEFITLFEEAVQTGGVDGSLVSRQEAADTQQLILDKVTDLLHEETLPIKILFVFREDYLGKLSILFENSPDLLDQYLRLKPPTLDSLQEIIRAPFKRKELSDAFAAGNHKAKGEELTGLADQIAAELRDHSVGGVNLSELQIVCRKLWESDNPAALFKQKKIPDLIEEYWADALKKFPGELYQPAVALLGHMITSSSTRNIVSEDDLLTQEKKHFSEELLRKSLEALVQSKLVRREPRYKLYFYEIVSEYLVPWIQRLKAQRDAELTFRENLAHAERENRVLRKWRRALTFVSVLMFALLLTAVVLGRMYLRAKASEVSAEKGKLEEGVKRVAAEEHTVELQKVLETLQKFTDPSAEVRKGAIRDIAALVGNDKGGLPPGAAKLLPAIILSDPDSTVIESGTQLLQQLVGKGLLAQASIFVESPDNQDQLTRASRLKAALVAKGVFVDDNQSGKSTNANVLRYCSISQGLIQPDNVAKLLSDVDGTKWSNGSLENCGAADATKQNYYEISFAAEREIAARDLVNLEHQWKRATAAGDRATLRRIFAKEFTNIDQYGQIYDKSTWISRLGGGLHSEVTETKLLSYSGNVATLRLVLKSQIGGSDYREVDIDSFVKRDGHWQVLSSQSTEQKPTD